MTNITAQQVAACDFRDQRGACRNPQGCSCRVIADQAAKLVEQATEIERLRADDRILWGIVANAGRLSNRKAPRWSHVSDAIGLGSTSSADLCRRFGFDSDELRGGHGD